MLSTTQLLNHNDLTRNGHLTQTQSNSIDESDILVEKYGCKCYITHPQRGKVYISSL